MTEKIITKHKTNKNYISVLQSIQDEFGFIPKNETLEISKALDIPYVKLWGVATFYSQFKLKKEGEKIIQVCDGTACHVNHSEELTKALEEELDLKAGETTKDGKFTLEVVNCIGACAKAPAIMMDEQVYGDLDAKKVKKIIKDLRS